MKLPISIILAVIGLYTTTQYRYLDNPEPILFQALAFARAIKGEWYWHLGNPAMWGCFAIVGFPACFPFLFVLLRPMKPLPEFDKKDHMKQS